MPIRIFLTMISFMLLVSSCHFKTRQEALQLNNTIVAVNDSLYFMGREFGSLINESYQSKDFSRIRSFRTGFEKFLDSSKKSMMELKDVGGSEPLRNCEIELLKIEQQMIRQDFVPFEQLSPASTGSEISYLFDNVQKDAKEETRQMKEFKRLQEEYALKNGFTLRGNIK